MNIAQVCLRLATIECAVLLYWGCLGGSENQSVSGVTTICLTSPSHRANQVVDCGLWNVGPLLFNCCAKLLDIDRNWNTLLYTCCIHVISRASQTYLMVDISGEYAGHARTGHNKRPL